MNLKLAYAYENLHERTHNDQLRKFLGVDPAKVAWCAYFVSAVLNELGLSTKKTGLARSFLKEGKEIPLRGVLPGDIVVLKRGKLPWQGHVGFFVRKNKSHVVLLGGNQGNKVCEKFYPIKDILGIRRIEHA